jgi:hypothetical protein
MVTSTHRRISDSASTFLPTQATTGGLEFARYLANRAWVLEAGGYVSHLRGDRQAIQALQTNAVHYYQRPDAGHLGVDSNATSLFGHGGAVHFGRSGSGRLRLDEHFLWYSPGLDLNDLGYLRQADDLANQVLIGWDESVPHRLFRRYSLRLTREDHWDFGGLHTSARTAAEGAGQLANQWEAQLELAYEDRVDTRMLRGGPALRWHDFFSVEGGLGTDPSRHVRASVGGEYSWARDDQDSRLLQVEGLVGLRLSNRVSFSGTAGYEALGDNLQYAATAWTDDGTRWVLGQLDQDTWSFTFRADLSVTPDLTVQFYGSPFVSTGRFTAFKKATDPLAQANADRFHLYASDEITYQADANAYEVTESSGGPTYALWQAQPNNVFLVKLSYWFSP